MQIKKVTRVIQPPKPLIATINTLSKPSFSGDSPKKYQKTVIT